MTQHGSTVDTLQEDGTAVTIDRMPDHAPSSSRAKACKHVPAIFLHTQISSQLETTEILH